MSLPTVKFETHDAYALCRTVFLRGEQWGVTDIQKVKEPEPEENLPGTWLTGAIAQATRMCFGPPIRARTP